MVKKIIICAVVAFLTMPFGVACSDKFDEGSNDIVIDDDDNNEDNEQEPVVKPEIFTFNHPCAYVSQADIERVKAKVAEANTADAVYASWLNFCQHGKARENYKPNPLPTVVRGDVKGTGVDSENYIIACEDAAAAFQLALRWKISGEEKYADAAVNILNSWADVCKKITSNDPHQYLVAGFQGYTFANAGELLRDYEGWAEKDFEDFKKWMVDLWYPKNHLFLTKERTWGTCTLHCWPNWELCNAMSMMAIGILTENNEMISFAYNEFTSGAGTCAIHNMIPYPPVADPSGKSTGMLAQNMESGRDQGHATLVISLAAEFAKMAHNIGLDMFGYENNLLLAMFEYTAKYNVKVDGRFITTTMPFTYFEYCGGSEGLCGCSGSSPHNHGAEHTAISEEGRGKERPCWDLIYNYYVNEKGMPESAVYYSKLFAEQLRYTNGELTGDGGAGVARYGSTSAAYDQLGWGTMLFTR